MLLASLPMQERKFYLLAFSILTVSLLLGLIVGVLGSGADADARPDNWQASQPKVIPDTLADFTAVTAHSRWFVEGGQALAAGPVAGEPETYKLLGITDKGNMKYALFMPPDTDSGRSKLVQLKVGDTLVDNWKVTDIASTKVQVSLQPGDESRDLLLYGYPAKASAAQTTSKHKSSPGTGANKTAPEKSARKTKPESKTQDKARPKKDSAQLEAARTERAEQRAKAKAEAARRKAEKDRAQK